MLIIPLFITVAESCSTNSVLLGLLKGGLSNFTGYSLNLVQFVFVAIILLCAISAFWLLKELVRLGTGKRKLQLSSNGILPKIAWFVFVSGMAIYYVGYAYAGTADCVVTLVLRSALSAFEMFLSKSNLIGIAENCKDNSIYMFCFAFFHTAAVAVSMIFAVACFGKRLFDYVKGIIWIYAPTKYRLNVFWGINEKSILWLRIFTKRVMNKK